MAAIKKVKVQNNTDIHGFIAVLALDTKNMAAELH